MKTYKAFFHSSLLAVAACLSVFGCYSCEGDDLSAPRVESVWSNMNTQPIEQVACAYPRQTICLRGSGFSGVDKLDVNGFAIDLRETQIYNTDGTIIIVLPDTVATTTDTGLAYIKVANAAGEYTYQPFYVFGEGEKPKISGFSTTTLTPGSSLRISGSNLGGAAKVYLPLTFGQKVECEFDPAQANSDTEVFVIVPDGVSFAQGQVSVVMHKTYAPTGDEYTETVYSDVTNFSN